MDKDNKLKAKMVIAIISVAMLIIGTSFAIFEQTINSSKNQVVVAGAVSLILTEETTGVTLDNLLEMSDSEGLAQDTYYEFTIENNGSAKASYDLYLIDNTTLIENFDGDILDDKYIKIGLKINGVETGAKNLEEVNRIIAHGTIDEDITNTYQLRIWLNFNGLTNAQKEEKLNDTLFLNLRISAEQITNQDTSGANEPEMVSGMIPVYYDSTNNEWKKADIYNYDENGKWYDYDNKMWGNVVTVTSANREMYNEAAIGTTINMSDVNGMYVWIPRYEYKYNNLGVQYAGGTVSEPNNVRINFLNEIEGVSDSTNYKVADAFSFGGTSKKGIWVGKFEVGGTLSNACTTETCEIGNVVIKPNATALTNQSLSSFYYIGRSMSQTNNAYGFSTITDETLDTHIMKNSEWGAVAYLTQSNYGRCTNGECIEVSINNCSNKVTGIGGTTVSATGDVASCTAEGNKYNGEYGLLGSTTGNIYGIYDMSGGSKEYVMGNHESAILESGFEELPNSKYINIYTGTSYIGHALNDVAGWYSDTSTFVNGTISFFTRGGSYSGGTGSGVMNYEALDGSNNIDTSTRIVIIK